VVGLRGQGFWVEALVALKKAYRIVYASDPKTSQVLARLETMEAFPSEVQPFIDFIKRSQRGISN